MKKFFFSVGLVAAGTAGLQAAYAPDQNSTDASRMWSVSGTLRGFYDNNYTTANSPAGSGGFEVSPQVSINVPLQQTEFGMRFVYGMYYYQARANENENPVDQTFQSDLWLDHAFSERWQTRVEDSFLYSQNPQLNTGGAVSNPFRTSQSYIANNGAVTLHTDWTREFSTSIYYHSAFYQYEENGGNAFNPSLAGELNRLGNTAGIDFQWHQSPTTTYFIGGNFSQMDYTGNEQIGFDPISGKIYNSDSRNSRSEAIYVGTTRSFTPNLVLSGRVGAQYSDYYNDARQGSQWNPYGHSALTYTYQPGCFAEIGVTETMNSTDEVSVSSKNGSITVSQQSTIIYGSINHKITPKLTGSLIGQMQFSSFNGGQYDGDVDKLYTAGINFSYAFNRHFSAEIGNNFNDLLSQVPGRSYTQNEVYAGVTATY